MKGIKLYPSEDQKIILDKFIEGYRIVYNWALQAEYNQYEIYNAGLSPRSFLSFYDLQELYKDFRKTSPLLLSIPSHTMINAVRDMVKGYESFFNHKDLFNKPHFKYDSWSISSFRPRSEPTSFYFNDNYLRIEGLHYGEMIETSYHTHTTDKVKYINPIIFRNNYTHEYTLNYVSEKQKIGDQLVDIPVSDPIGVDVNRKILYACSNGINIEYIDTSRVEKHLSKLNQKISEDRDRYKDTVLSTTAIYRLEERRQLYAHISNIHRDRAYKGSLEIIRCNPEAIILESLDIKSIMSHKYIADDLQFHPLGVAQQILEEQAFKYDIPVYYAPKNLESSNICSCCGSYNNIGSNKYFRCDKCGSVLQRDTNAAINLKNWYISNYND